MPVNSEALDKLKTECPDSMQLRKNVDLLIKIFRNINLHPEDDTFQTIKVDKISAKPKAFQEFLANNGFELVGGCYTYVSGVGATRNVLDVLTGFRCDVKPQAREWVEENKIEDLTTSWIDAKERKLRADAAVTREKELAAYAENKEYEKTVAQCARAEAREDRRRKELLSGASGGQAVEKLSEDIKNTATIRASKAQPHLVAHVDNVNRNHQGDSPSNLDDDPFGDSGVSYGGHTLGVSPMGTSGWRTDPPRPAPLRRYVPAPPSRRTNPDNYGAMTVPQNMSTYQYPTVRHVPNPGGHVLGGARITQPNIRNSQVRSPRSPDTRS